MASTAVLFDFDGTLADTAGDLTHALNKVRAEQGMEALPLEQMRPHASAGARGLLGAGMNVLPEHPEYGVLRERFLKHYADSICVETRLFPGMAELLGALEARGVRWGIVTNKSERLTRPLVQALGLEGRPACIVGGDTTPHLKPHPASLQHAARLLALDPAACIYAGDDLRDIQAAIAAGMRPVAVHWGYGAGMQSWNAEVVVREPMDLLALLRA